jgi:hypothetical protein
MRLLFLPAFTAILLLADQSAWAQSIRARCLVNPGPIKVDGITDRELRIRAGHPCHLYLYSYAGWHINVHAVHITVPPARGTLRASEKTGGRADTVTYVPSPGFIGHDRFEVFYQWTAFIRPASTLYKADVTVTP